MASGQSFSMIHFGCRFRRLGTASEAEPLKSSLSVLSGIGSFSTA
jgi:hypothetical protein